MTVGGAEPKSLVACCLTKDCNKSCGVEVGLKKPFSFKITGLNTCWYASFSALCFIALDILVSNKLWGLSTQ